jgi:hypothetical protein
VKSNGRLVITNEFASVEIRVDELGHGPLAYVTDRKSGVTRKIDPLALEGLVWAPDSLIESLADPGHRGD